LKPPESRRPLLLVRTVAALLSALTLTLTGVAWYGYRHLLSGSDALGRSVPHVGMNILLIGLDSRKDQDGNPLPPQILDKLHAGDGNEGGYNTNTLILMHIPADGSKVVAFSIPRDDLVDIPGAHPDKIKEAYGFAKAAETDQLVNQGVTDQHQLETQGREAGRRATLDVVRTLTGVPIDHFAEVNLAGFYHAASALGRIEVCLNGPVHDDASGANFPGGHQWLDGEQALEFVRQRHNLRNGDLDRTHRQQAFLAGVMAELHSTGILGNPAKLRALLDIARQDIVVDSHWDLLSFAAQTEDLTGGNLEFRTLPIQGFARLGEEDVNIIDPARIRDLVRTAFGEQPPPPPVHTVVDVRNANGTPRLATQVMRRLAAAHITTGNAWDTESADSSEVLYNPDSRDTATKVAAILGGLPTEEDSTLPGGQVQVLLGADFPDTDGSAAVQPQAVVSVPPPPPGPEGNPVRGDVPCVN
jgi:LCP family protein required for cell wall assembly